MISEVFSSLDGSGIPSQLGQMPPVSPVTRIAAAGAAGSRSRAGAFCVLGNAFSEESFLAQLCY